MLDVVYDRYGATLLAREINTMQYIYILTFKMLENLLCEIISLDCRFYTRLATQITLTYS
jgi:hypothetical protein